MIYWSEEKGGWAFDQVTNVEKEKIIELGYQTIMPAIAGTVLSRLMSEVPPLESMDKDDMFNA